MTKILVVLFIGLVCEAIGVVLLKEGINAVCKGQDVTLQNAFPLFLKGVAQLRVILGVFFEALFFVCLLYLMSQKDISFIWPLTSLSFVMTTLAAVFYLKEPVSTARWLGVALIMVGAAIITWNEKQNERLKEHSTAAAPASQQAVRQ
jgi:drug/metabolite transporter (DMT)-like permease